MSIQNSKEEKTEEYYLFTYPRTFRQDDPAIIAVCGKRLKEIRNKRRIESKNNDKIVRKKWSQEAIGKELGISAAGYGKYENANTQTLPMKYMVTLCDIYNVTPHYLLGYADDEQSVVVLDDNHDIVMENGKPKQLISAFVIPVKMQKKLLCSYQKLMVENPSLFHLIGKLMSAPDNKKTVCATVLSLLLDNL